MRPVGIMILVLVMDWIVQGNIYMAVQFMAYAKRKEDSITSRSRTSATGGKHPDIRWCCNESTGSYHEHP
jgi:hypothetical protein